MGKALLFTAEDYQNLHDRDRGLEALAEADRTLVEIVAHLGGDPLSPGDVHLVLVDLNHLRRSNRIIKTGERRKSHGHASFLNVWALAVTPPE